MISPMLRPATAGAIVAAMAASAPLWVTYFVPQVGGLTVGRLLIAALALAVLLSLRSGANLRRPTRAGWVALGCLALAGLLVVVSTLTRGCTCDGAVYGFVEFVVVAGLAAGAVALAPRSARAILVGIGTGAVLMAVLALASVDDLHSSLEPPDPGAISDRLSGPLGNPNLLGLYLALALPVVAVAIVLTRGRRRMAVSLALLPVVWALVETFSRGSMLAAVVGVLVALGVTVGVDARQRRRLVPALAALLVLGAIGSASFGRLRTEADFGARLHAGEAIDRGGWDARALGPIPSGPSRMANARPRALDVLLDNAGEGVSFPLAPGDSGSRYLVEFAAHGDVDNLPISYALQDNVRADSSPRLARGAVSSGRDRSFSLSWTAPVAVSQPRLYIWSPAAGGTITLTRVTVADPAHRTATAISLALRGSRMDEYRARAAALERRYVASRRAVLEESLRVFASHALLGIGWQRFPAHAEVALHGNGAYATHNEYTRFLAELGISGGVILLALMAAVALTVRRVRPRGLRGAVAGVLASGAVGLVFVNALAQPAVSLFLALAIGIAIGASGTRPWSWAHRRGQRTNGVI